MSFKNVNLVSKKVKGVYTLRLATNEESTQQAIADRPSWKGGNPDNVKKIAGFQDCVLYPPNHVDNTISIQSDKLFADFNFKTGKGKLFIKGMSGYSGHNGGAALCLYGIPFEFSPEIVQAVLNQLPAKGTIVNHGIISTKY